MNRLNRRFDLKCKTNGKYYTIPTTNLGITTNFGIATNLGIITNLGITTLLPNTSTLSMLTISILYHLYLLCSPKTCLSISTSTKQPSLLWMPHQVQHTKTVCDLVARQLLQRHQQWVGHEVVIDGCVEHVD